MDWRGQMSHRAKTTIGQNKVGRDVIRFGIEVEKVLQGAQMEMYPFVMSNGDYGGISQSDDSRLTLLSCKSMPCDALSPIYQNIVINRCRNR